ncbi:hypothetical protein ACQKL6_13365 [Peribacillus sp. NPDC097197]|uniref:hypothetical protein n=1 Tax=Peribacillus sp. NPDC097197 TaxID=3390615 RepID=UPI003CFE8600
MNKSIYIKEYFFCYSIPLFKFLKMDRGISFVCYALNDKTLAPFWLYQKTEELTLALKEYKTRN